MGILNFRVFEHKRVDSDYGCCEGCKFIAKTWLDWTLHSLAVTMDGGTAYHTIALLAPRD
jgi:hypothetical protein